MALELQLNPLTVPSGTEFPGTVQGLLQLIAEYEEITGGEDFNGVNYGSVEPDPADRDKAWLRTDGSGNFLGWYVWTGAAWTILPSKAYVGDVATRDALANPQDGWMFHVVGTGLSTYVESEAEWQWAFPAANQDLVGDKQYLFSSHQLLATATGQVNIWAEIDLAPYIASAGLSADNITAAIVRLDNQFGSTGAGGAATFSTTIRAWGDNTVSSSAGDVLVAFCLGARDGGGACAASNTVIGPVPLPDPESLYYVYNETGSPASMQGIVWLVGFVYTPSAT